MKVPIVLAVLIGIAALACSTAAPAQRSLLPTSTQPLRQRSPKKEQWMQPLRQRFLGPYQPRKQRPRVPHKQHANSPAEKQSKAAGLGKILETTPAIVASVRMGHLDALRWHALRIR